MNEVKAIPAEMETTLTSLQRINALKQQIEDKTLRAQEVAQTNAVIRHTLNTSRIQIRAVTTQGAAIKVSIKLLIFSLAEVLSDSDPDALKALVQETVKLVVGMSPVGTLASLLESLALVTERRAQQLSGATNYLQKLDAYISACRGWCICAQRMIDTLVGLSGDETAMQANQEVEQRFNGLVERLKSGIEAQSDT